MKMEKIFKDKIVLVTGGVGSIGSEIVNQLLKYAPKQIRVFDNRETELFHMQHKLLEFDNLRFLIGDIRDKERLNIAMENVDIVFHAAALKHVPLCEYNPFEAVKTNVYGTQNVIETALLHNVEKVINISTDKVTNTINTMGATKLLSERIVTAAQYYKGNKKTLFSSVRFGNVVGSRGSVIDLFEKQIKKGGPVTLTHPDMTRFIMTLPQAVSLVLKTAAEAQGGEIFILKMPVFKLKDLSETLIEEIAPKHNLAPKAVKVKVIGLRPGEKMHESLMTEEESTKSLETQEMFILLSELIIPNMSELKRVYKNAKMTSKNVYASSKEKPLTKEELRTLLINERLI
jgi:FlaA1/EpsC-like NDP-sugar epimerase